MFIKSTGGAWTISNDYVLYLVDPIKKSLTEQQIIFEFAREINEGPVGGEAVLRFLDDTNDRIEITELLDHSYEEKRKGTFVTVFQFDRASMKYKKIN